MKVLRHRITTILKDISNKTKNALWIKMEFKRIWIAVIALFRVFIRIITYPFIWIDYLFENTRRYINNNTTKPKEPSSKQIRSRMVAAIIDGILDNKNSVVGGSSIKKVKVLSILLLELASLITTVIGMTIVASDISPVIAIIWAVVIQGLAGTLSATRGKWNKIILVICLCFSITSDYICYINAVYPYDIYIESQYTTFKTSYDLAWERASELVQKYEASSEKIDAIFDEIETTLAKLGNDYNISVLPEKQRELERLKNELNDISPTLRDILWYNTYTNQITGEVYSIPEYSSEYENPIYINKNEEIKVLNSEIEKIKMVSSTVSLIKNSIKNMAKDEKDGRERVKDLLKTITSSHAESEEALEEANKEYATLSNQLLSVEKQINELLTDLNDGNGLITEHNIEDIKNGKISYSEIDELELSNFDKIRDSVNTNNSSVFDKIFVRAAEFIDSDFAVNAVDLKKEAEKITNENYELFIESTADLVLKDEELEKLIYGSVNENDNSEEESEMVVPPLQSVYKNIEYRDALSKGISYLIHPEGGIIEIFSRVLYAFLADGIVLLIGLSLRRKNTAIYRVRSRKDLTNEEPRLISEAFYNLSARQINENDSMTYTIETLLLHLGKFISYFEPTPFMHDINLNTSYSLICIGKGKIDELNKQFTELICLLQSLKYVKVISLEQYNYFKQYKLNKAVLDSDNTDEYLPNLNGKDEEYCYLLTEGFTLYFYEKLNDLYQHIESDTYKDEITKELNNIIANKGGA